MAQKSRFDVERWHYRGYLPHFEGGTAPQFITFRLADSLPRSYYHKLRLRKEAGVLSEAEYILAIDRALDESKGFCHLEDGRVASAVRDSIFFLENRAYRLHSWVIMPNHVHLLISPNEDKTLSQIMQSLKSFTAHKCNKILKREGRFWSKEYFDRYMRDFDHFRKTVRYIEMNPVKAGLVQAPEAWEFSSAFSGLCSENV